MSVLLEQIEAVANSRGFTSMPSGICTILQRAVSARTRCAEWYEAAKKNPFMADNGGHRHFIGILQSALSKLDPAIVVGGSSGSKAAAAATANNTKKQPSPNPSVAHLG